MIEQALYQRLTAHAGLAALVSSRIYPGRLPQNPTYPAVLYFTVSGTRESVMGEDTGIARRRVQVSAFAETFTSASDVAEQVRAALQRWRGTLDGTEVLDIFVENGPFNFYDDVAKVFHHPTDFEVIYRE